MGSSGLVELKGSHGHWRGTAHGGGCNLHGVHAVGLLVLVLVVVRGWREGAAGCRPRA